jgi:tRNA G18 (ribose-2'-O)-methylase SpoU
MPHESHPDRVIPDVRSTLDEIGRLQVDRSHRDTRRAFFVEGVRNVVQAIESGFRIETLIYSEKLLIVPIARRLVRDQCRSGTPTLYVSPEDFRRVSTTPRASRLGRGCDRRSGVVVSAQRLAEDWALLGLTRGDPLRGESREPDPDL